MFGFFAQQQLQLSSYQDLSFNDLLCLPLGLGLFLQGSRMPKSLPFYITASLRAH